MSSKKGFTLLEIIVTVTIIAILVALVVPQILQRARKAEEAEALVNLGAIRRAQLDLHGISGRFVEAADEKGIQAALGLSISNLIYDFKIIDADEDNFLGVATPVDALESWLEEIKIDKDGFVGYSGYGDGGDGSGGGSSSEGSDSGGGSGGGGGGSSGGGRSGSTGGTGVTGTGKTPDSIIVSSETSAPPFTGYADDIKEALDILLLMTDELESEGAVTGKFLAEFAAVNQISISFASETPCGDGAAGCHQGYAFNGTIASVITVLDTYKDNIYAAAAITAHEILHAVWHKDYYEYYFGQKRRWLVCQSPAEESVTLIPRITNTIQRRRAEKSGIN
jgi:prepilin-type N-terminal cleavage/methylation domain-containing protein